MKNTSIHYSWAPNQDIFVKAGKASESHRPYQFCLLKTQLSHAEFYKKYSRQKTNYSITQWLKDNGPLASDKRHNPKKEKDHRLIDECINWLQVWSLTQFYSVDFSQSRISGKTKEGFSTIQSRFASVVVDSVLGPPRLARHT